MFLNLIFSDCLKGKILLRKTEEKKTVDTLQARQALQAEGLPFRIFYYNSIAEDLSSARKHRDTFEMPGTEINQFW